MPTKKPTVRVELDKVVWDTLVEPHRTDEKGNPALIHKVLENCQKEKLEGTAISSDPVDVFKNHKVDDKQEIFEKLGVDSASGQMSPMQLLVAAMRVTGLTEQEILNDAVVLYTQRLITKNVLDRERKQPNDPSDPEQRKGIKGAVDHEIEAAVKVYFQQKEKYPTASWISKNVGTNYYTAKRWLQENAN